MENLITFITTHSMLVTAFAVVLLLFLANEVRIALCGIRQFTPEQTVQSINNDGAIVIDLRDNATFRKGHILNAHNIPNSELAPTRPEIASKENQQIILVCQTGQQAFNQAMALKKSNFTSLAILKSGFQSWQQANLPCVTK